MKSLKQILCCLASLDDSDDNEIKSPIKPPTHESSSVRSSQLGTSSNTNTRTNASSAIISAEHAKGMQAIILRGKWSALSSARGSRDSAAEGSLRGLLLQDRIHLRRHGWIIPRSKIEELITVPAVTMDIRANDPDIDLTTAHQYAERVCDDAKHLYTVLVCLRMSASIGKLLDEGINDSELPLSMTEDRSFGLRRKDGQAIHVFATWSEELLENFHYYQYRVTAPIFNLYQHYEFDTCTILPFVRLHEGEEFKAKEGAYSAVFPVRIHPDYHNFWPQKTEDEEPLIAIKQLFSSKSSEFEKERNILLHLSSRNNPHLIKLLATFKQDNKYHLIFPFADANLRTYWYKLNPKPCFDEQTALWTITQLHGISMALQLIHNLSNTPPLNATNSSPQTLEATVQAEVYGRHGDIKPENILWFAKENGGTLQVADFGLGRFHGRDSRSKVDPYTVGASPTYSPPEMVLHLPVSRAYDIWSLGCLFLEFLTWLLEGSDAVEEFSEFRGSLDPNTLLDDDYFYTIRRESSGTTAVVRRGVVDWVKRLHAHKNCSKLIHELLDITMYDLLVIAAKNRIGAISLTELLGERLEKAQGNRRYLLEPLHKWDSSRPPSFVFETPMAKSQPMGYHPSDNLPKDLAIHKVEAPSIKRSLTWPSNAS